WRGWHGRQADARHLAASGLQGIVGAVDLDVIAPAPDPSSDQVVLLRGVGWSLYTALVAERGERSVPRLHYLEGDLQVMSPSRFHETDAGMIDFLLRVWSDETETELN